MKDIDSRFVELENIVYDNNFVREFVEDLHIEFNKLQAENKRYKNFIIMIAETYKCKCELPAIPSCLKCRAETLLKDKTK